MTQFRVSAQDISSFIFFPSEFIYSTGYLILEGLSHPIMLQWHFVKLPICSILQEDIFPFSKSYFLLLDCG